MARIKGSLLLRQFVLRLVLYRLFIPLLCLGWIALIGAAYMEFKEINVEQMQIAKSISTMVEHYIDQGSSVLNAVAMAGQEAGPQNVAFFMKSTIQSNCYFDTLYYLDAENKIRFMTPNNTRYEGMDLSNLPVIQMAESNKNYSISRPFISLRTGEPTVYLVSPLSSEGYILGELNLGLLQNEIANISSNKDFIFILDQMGKLLAHPDPQLVKQQNNFSNLRIFENSRVSDTSMLYNYDGKKVLASAAHIGDTGWVVVDQIPLTVLLQSYGWCLFLILTLSFLIWFTVVVNLRKQFQKYIISPLEQLSQETNAITEGNFNHIFSLSTVPGMFIEIKNLAEDFTYMSNSLKLREAAMIELNEKLEEEIKVLNCTKAELTLAKKEADKANIAKSNFISNVSHELRTPITVILSIVQLMEKNTEDETPTTNRKIEKHIRSMKQNCYRLLRLVNNIIDVTQIDAGFTSLDLKNLNIVSLIEDIVTSVIDYAKYKGISVIFNTDEEELFMAVDRNKIERIILNLLSNGIKFTPRNGEINIDVSTSDDHNQVHISIEDTGIGIPEEKKQLIFERFQQIDDSFTRDNEGSGIGLSIVKAFVELHGGTISVSSEIGHGSRFLIRLPVRVLENEQNYPESKTPNNSAHSVQLLNVEFSDIYF